MSYDYRNAWVAGSVNRCGPPVDVRDTLWGWHRMLKAQNQLRTDGLHGENHVEHPTSHAQLMPPYLRTRRSGGGGGATIQFRVTCQVTTGLTAWSGGPIAFDFFRLLQFISLASSGPITQRDQQNSRPHMYLNSLLNCRNRAARVSALFHVPPVSGQIFSFPSFLSSLPLRHRDERAAEPTYVPLPLAH